MRFALDKPVTIVMLGAGGTGGHTATHLYRLLHSLNRYTQVVICDGDIVEEKNLVRQNFIAADLGKNKAQVLAERYATAFGLEVSYIPDFIEDKEKLARLVQPLIYEAGMYQQRIQDGLSILIGCVDNNRSRQLCHQVFMEANNLIYIDSGNGEYTGQVVCGVRRNGKTYYKPIGDVYPDVLLDNDKFPTQLGCAEAAVSAPQSIVANVTASTAIVSYLYNILVLGSIETRSITFSTKSINVKPILTQKRKRPAISEERRKQIAIQTQQKNMKAIYDLVTQNLSYLSGPNGAKKQFHTKAASFLRTLGNDLGFTDFIVKKNYGGIAVSGEIRLKGMWSEGNGVYFMLDQETCGRQRFLYRTIKHMKDSRGGPNQYVDGKLFKEGNYELLMETLLSLNASASSESRSAAGAVNAHAA